MPSLAGIAKNSASVGGPGGDPMKLYWRVKINGKWTWRPAVVQEQGDDDDLDPRAFQWYLIKTEVE